MCSYIPHPGISTISLERHKICEYLVRVSWVYLLLVKSRTLIWIQPLVHLTLHPTIEISERELRWMTDQVDQKEAGPLNPIWFGSQL